MISELLMQLLIHSEQNMKSLLQINTSIFSDNGQSSRLANEFVAGWREAYPGSEVVVRDLAVQAVPHLDEKRAAALFSKPLERNAEQQTVVDYSDSLVKEVRRADVLVIGLPLYNFSVPSNFKAYLDHIARAGVTFRYTENGPVGLLSGKKAYVFAARGGLYRGTPFDTQTPYMRNFLGFIGITDVEFVYAEGLNMGEQAKQTGLAGASAAIRELLEPLRKVA
jgi:FMN-dependent NADH-azoreductase